jgi:virginiamycin B lyase
MHTHGVIRRLRRGVTVGAAVLLAVVGTACGSSSESSGPPAPTGVPGTKGDLEPLPVTATIRLPGEPMLTAVAGGKLWVSFVDDGSIAAVDPATNELGRWTRIGNGAGTHFDNPLASDGRELWAVDNANDRVIRVDPKTGAAGAATDAESVIELTVAFGSVWIAQFEGYKILRLDPVTNRVVARLSAAGPTDVDAGAGSIWVLAHRADEVLRLDPATNRVAATIALETSGSTPERMAFGEGALWVTDPRGDSVTRVDSAANRPTVEVIMPGETKSYPVQVSTGGGYIWVAGERHVFRIDPRTNKVTGAAQISETIDLRYGALTDVEYAFDSVWAVDRLNHRLVRLGPTANDSAAASEGQ